MDQGSRDLHLIEDTDKKDKKVRCLDREAKTTVRNDTNPYPMSIDLVGPPHNYRSPYFTTVEELNN